MSAQPNVLDHISRSLEQHVAAASRFAVAVRNAAHQHVSGLLWRPDAVVTSEQAIGSCEEYEIVTADGTTSTARIAGRDNGTNLLVLRPERELPVQLPSGAAPRTGALAIACSSGGNGNTTAHLGIVNSVGPQWYSRAGGRIEQRIALDIRLRRTEEGGPVLDASGALFGMSTLGPPGETLVIPYATIERVVPELLRDGRAARGWLGLALQAVAVPDALRESTGQGTGMMVLSIADGGPGANAGVTPGDILLTIDGTPVRSARSLAAQLDDRSIGKTVELRVIRGGQVSTLAAVVATRS